MVPVVLPHTPRSHQGGCVQGACPACKHQDMKYSASLSRIPWNNAEDASCQVLLMSAGLFSGEENVLGLHVPFCPGQELSCHISVAHQLAVLCLPSCLRSCREVGTAIWMTTDISTITTSCSNTSFPVIFVPGASPPASLSPPQQCC